MPGIGVGRKPSDVKGLFTRVADKEAGLLNGLERDDQPLAAVVLHVRVRRASGISFFAGHFRPFPQVQIVVSSCTSRKLRVLALTHFSVSANTTSVKAYLMPLVQPRQTCSQFPIITARRYCVSNLEHLLLPAKSHSPGHCRGTGCCAYLGAWRNP